MGKSTPAAPPPPDPAATANAQTGSNVNTAVANSILGNANEVTPYGSVSYTQNGSTHIGGPSGGGPSGYGPVGGGTIGQRQALPGTASRLAGGGGGFNPGYDIPSFTRTTTLSPEEQQKFNQQEQLGIGINDLALGQTARLKGTLDTPLTTEGLPDRVNSLGPLPTFRGYNLDRVGDAGPIQTSVGPEDFSADRKRVETALFDRIDPLLQRDKTALETNLVNQGFQRGTQAFTDAMDQYGRQENDARLAVTAQGGDEQQRMFDMLMARGQFGNTAQQQIYDQMVGRAGFNNATQQAEVDRSNANEQGLYGLKAQAADFQNTQREAGLQERTSVRNQPINEVSALMSGGQVSLPNFAAYHSGTVAPTDYMGAAYNTAALQNQQWQTQQQTAAQKQAALYGGLGGLGGAGLYGLAGGKLKLPGMS
jgi:hypothetical protein